MMMKEKYVVRFFYECESFPFSDRNLLKEFIVKLFKNEKYKLGSLHYIFCTDDALRKMNKKFVAVACHRDIIEWLEPDWIYDTDEQMFFFANSDLKDQKLTSKYESVGHKYGDYLESITI